MADLLSDLVEKRHPKSVEAYYQTLREVIQEFMLLALWRGKFFNQAAFYGGTALRLFYGLDRFSEDLDFTLLHKSSEFRFEPWFRSLERELSAQGLEVRIDEKEASSKASTDQMDSVESAVLSTNMRQALIEVGAAKRIYESQPINRLIKIRFQADIDPAFGFESENKLLLEPLPFSVKILTPASLFAGKFHALLERDWKHRVKGRDWYDFVFFVRKGIPVQLQYLDQKLKAHHEKSAEIGYDSTVPLSAEIALSLLAQRIVELDVEAAREEVYPFVSDTDQLSLWSREFFLEILNRVRFI